MKAYEYCKKVDAEMLGGDMHNLYFRRYVFLYIQIVPIDFRWKKLYDYFLGMFIRSFECVILSQRVDTLIKRNILELRNF